MRFLLRLLCFLLPIRDYPNPAAFRGIRPRASTPAPDFVPDAELQFTTTRYPHVIAHFERCYRLLPHDPQDRVRPD
jgi:hypothetical protein